jgi:hypothetical protein
MAKREPVGWLALLLSVVALGVSMYSAEQARRAAVASERQAGIAEEQTRPRLQFTEPTAQLAPSSFSISVKVKNIGSAPAVINNARVETLAQDVRGIYAYTDAINAIIYPNDSRQFSLTKPRVIRQGTPQQVDYGNVNTRDFTFTASYYLLGRNAIDFSESVQFPTLEWARPQRSSQQ